MGSLFIPKGFNLGTLIVGAGAVILAPVLLPVVGGVLKSLSKAVIKVGMISYEKGKLLMEETKETIEDLTEEAKAELTEESKAPVAKPQKAAAAK